MLSVVIVSTTTVAAMSINVPSVDHQKVDSDLLTVKGQCAVMSFSTGYYFKKSFYLLLNSMFD